ncbi:hypothetical protein PFDSM3638_07410 [Pyrococcus furiosus DSM 3638]|uniref:Uncharacterized protein n=3 Tax=Pyrococcus furiosus TaxID=2261 RepID=A0A5C0XQK6_PYRFU|nr:MULTISPECIES: hypothetical protein [Pyrococcus]AAL81602.1 hypothetical protein PF1478 [Pyrococcus furiosus DSM 3638]AFN04261.1 hypothetical protein PFC_06625 [Pyrococcus furiosus COM1]MDK2870560.1 hypothetical protein [Pyrococcus sp.]QEK79107.1 hypothetical protein PFDSM3638_07410 [Pyrococcus furiosus DSM 3638]
MIPQAHLKVLYKIYDKPSKTDVKWTITGSLGFALQGVPIEPHDIDIQTNKEGACKIEELFSEFVIEPVKFKESDKI